MLSNVTWTLFLTSLLIVTILYYLYVAVVYYPKEVLALVFGKDKKDGNTAFVSQPVPERGGQDIDEVYDEQYYQRFQPSGNPDANNAEEQLPFQSVLNNTEEEQPGILLIGIVSDLAQAIKTLIQVTADAQGEKEELQQHLSTLLAKYPKVAKSKYRQPINELIFDQCQIKLTFALSIEQIDELWNDKER